ncbi:MAG: T9SS type A sorting domain-containing protein [Bacteroidota bacterium]
MKKIHVYLLLLLMLPFAGLRASCVPAGAPGVIVNDHCGQPGTFVTVPVFVENWNNVHAWNFYVCFSQTPGYSLVAVQSHVSGQNISVTNNPYGLHVTYGTPGSCKVPKMNNARILTMKFYIDPLVAKEECLDINICPLPFQVFPSAYECTGAGLVHHTPVSCAGSVCVGPGFNTVDIRGRVRTQNGMPLANFEIFEISSGISDVTDIYGNYKLNNVPASCVDHLDLWGYHAPSTDGIDWNDHAILEDIIDGVVTPTCDQMLTGDVTYGGSLTGLDEALLEAHLNGVDPYVANVGYWNFYLPGSVDNCNPSLPWVPAVPNPMEVMITAPNMTNVDIIAYKWGDLDGNATTKRGAATAPQPVPAAQEATFAPQPFRDQVNLSFELGQAGAVELNVFDLKGQKVAEMQWQMEQGQQAIPLETATWPAGLLLYKLQTPNGLQTGRIVHLGR